MSIDDFNLSYEQKLKLTTLRILVVEDNAVDRELIKAYLEVMGLRYVQEASNGAEGLFKINNANSTGIPFHIIMTDWKMPQKDGLTFLKELRSEKAKKRIYIIMLTSVVDAERVRAVMLAGVDDYILKPIQEDVLIKKILAASDKVDTK